MSSEFKNEGGVYKHVRFRADFLLTLLIMHFRASDTEMNNISRDFQNEPDRL